MLLTGNGDLVHKFTVQIANAIDAHTGQLCQLLTARNTNVLIRFFVVPDRNRRTPESVTTDCPIPCILQPPAHTSSLDGIRHPTCRLIIFQNPITNGLHIDEPTGNGPINQRSITSPTVRVGVNDGRFLHQAATALKRSNELWVGFLHMHAFTDGHFFRKQTTGIHGARNVHILVNNAVAHTNAVIILTKCRCLVNDTGTTLTADIVISYNRPKVGSTNMFLEKVKYWLVGQSNQIFTIHCRNGLVQLSFGWALEFLGRHLRKELDHTGLENNVLGLHLLIAGQIFNEDVLHAFIHTKSQVARKCPWGGGPSQQTRALELSRSRHWKRHHHSWVGHILVIQSSFEVGQWRCALG
mmetsp:Transcript_7278/g.10729  ORF Transcript_7278/g.10729 Transcript_7278/m.10729 type:complete len:354 (+) Transcript_7278:1966-3027(+)